MRRQPLPDRPRLEALLDERDHLRIRISLLTDSASPDVTELAELRIQLRDLDRRIAATDRAP